MGGTGTGQAFVAFVLIIVVQIIWIRNDLFNIIILPFLYVIMCQQLIRTGYSLTIIRIEMLPITHMLRSIILTNIDQLLLNLQLLMMFPMVFLLVLVGY